MKKLSLSLFLIAGAVHLAFGAVPAVTEIGPPLQLTTDHYYMAPVWSPTATVLAITGSQYTGIYLLSYPAGTVRQITDDHAAGYGMQWAHSGNTIAAKIAKYEQDKRYDAVAIFNTQTGTKQLLTDYQTLLPGIPKWTDHDSYVYLSESRKVQLFDTNQSGTANRIQDVPTGEPLAYIVQDQLHYKSTNSNTIQSIPDLPGQPLNLTVSPDGKKIAYEILGGHLWTANIDGSDPVDLGIGYEPGWNPGSDKLTYMITEDDGHDYTASDIFVINADGSGKINITNTRDILEMHPSWSYDGHLIAYNSYKTGFIIVREIQ